MNKDKALKVTGNIFIVIGILILFTFFFDGDFEDNPYFWEKYDWIFFLITYITFSFGVILRSFSSGNLLSIKKIAIFLYMTGFFILIAIWEWQKTIPSPLGDYISYLIYFIGFFYPLLAIFFIHKDSKQTLKEWLQEKLKRYQ